MRLLLFIIIAVVGGYGMTLYCYLEGGLAVQPGLFLAGLFFKDGGGDTLILPFQIITTTIYAIVIYTILWIVTKRRENHAFNRESSSNNVE